MEECMQPNTTNTAIEVFTVSTSRAYRVIDEYFDAQLEFDPSYQEHLKIADILAGLTRDRIVLRGTIRAQAMTIGRLLVQRGAYKVHMNVGARWDGVRWKA